jgi:hypothetical protein
MSWLLPKLLEEALQTHLQHNIMCAMLHRPQAPRFLPQTILTNLGLALVAIDLAILLAV